MSKLELVSRSCWKKADRAFLKAEIGEVAREKFPEAEIRTIVPRTPGNRPENPWRASESENSGMPENSRPESKKLYTLSVFSDCLCCLDMMLMAREASRSLALMAFINGFSLI